MDTRRTSGIDPQDESTQNGVPADDSRPDAGAAAAAAGDDVDTVKQQRDEFQDLLLRKTAEFDNYRRRVERERRELAEFAAADLLQDLLPLVDDLERALQAAPETQHASVNAYRQGVELINKQLVDLLRKRGVTPIDTRGADFDPHIHQAIGQEHSDDLREGEVIEVRRGYKLGDRLLRPAMVKVATRG